MTIKRVPGSDEIWDLRDYDPMTDNAIGLDWLHQDKEWIDGSGTRRQLVDMETSHLVNLKSWLRRQATYLEFVDGMTMLASPIGSPRSIHSQDAVDEWLDERGENPVGWLESTPLFEAIEAEIAKRVAGIDGMTEEPY